MLLNIPHIRHIQKIDSQILIYDNLTYAKKKGLQYVARFFYFLPFLLRATNSIQQ